MHTFSKSKEKFNDSECDETSPQTQVSQRQSSSSSIGHSKGMERQLMNTETGKESLSSNILKSSIKDTAIEENNIKKIDSPGKISGYP